MTNVVPVPPTSGPEADEVRGEPEAVPSSQSQQQRVWSMPKPPVTRKQADEVGRIALNAGAAIIGFIAGVARYGARAVRHLSRAIEAVPPAVRLLTLMGVLILLGIVGAIALDNPLGLASIIVVVPVCSITLGALGHRWYSGLGGQPMPRVESPAAGPSVPDLQRSVEYVDKKLTFALNAFGAERQQHAMIALFQAKTAIELTLGTEQDAASHIDALLSVEDHDARPRIRAGSASKSLRESNSLAAS
ncbi:hypothetical protein FZI95_22145 [Mycobacterium sp. CBMA247]|nr:hypothetical protein [Mycolicibacterium sp. CBMA 329]MUL88859.1 hypothetical protein [Mycolicibacterium sp. CBMA 331]MUM01867.1 hypothetical protein [Mycolicibacterium sp. CBMA 334]MUM29197.1 hypothetical protein [Mycolicibacterium sp. CBMA 295]MUM40506.1 hypothetical protein [Mycolicibacterium sp. CBMA 247]MUM44923.1 hypothetical protein [Mycolicibacterium sp. CBMA 294]